MGISIPRTDPRPFLLISLHYQLSLMFVSLYYQLSLMFVAMAEAAAAAAAAALHYQSPVLTR